MIADNGGRDAKLSPITLKHGGVRTTVRTLGPTALAPR